MSGALSVAFASQAMVTVSAYAGAASMPESVTRPKIRAAALAILIDLSVCAVRPSGLQGSRPVLLGFAVSRDRAAEMVLVGQLDHAVAASRELRVGFLPAICSCGSAVRLGRERPPILPGMTSPFRAVQTRLSCPWAAGGLRGAGFGWECRDRSGLDRGDGHARAPPALARGVRPGLSAHRFRAAGRSALRGRSDDVQLAGDARIVGADVSREDG